MDDDNESTPFERLEQVYRYEGGITVSIGDQGDMATWFERQGRLHIEDIDGGRVDLYPDQIDDLVKFIERIKGERDE